MTVLTINEDLGPEEPGTLGHATLSLCATLTVWEGLEEETRLKAIDAKNIQYTENKI